MVFGALVKPTQAIYYPPDGSGRDNYIITTNGGTCNRYKMGGTNIYFTPENTEFLRSAYTTPKMNRRQTDKIPSNKTYNNWPSLQTVKMNKVLYTNQKEQTDRLSPRGQVEREQDPIAKIVQDLRAKTRASSTLKATTIMLESSNTRTSPFKQIRADTSIEMSPRGNRYSNIDKMIVKRVDEAVRNITPQPR